MIESNTDFWVFCILEDSQNLFFYAAGLRSDYWSTTGTGNSPLGSFVAEEWLENKAPHSCLQMQRYCLVLI